MLKKLFIIYLITVVIYFVYQNNLRNSYQEKITPISADFAVNNSGSSSKPEGNVHKYNFFSDGYTNLNISSLEKYSLTAMVASKTNYTERWNSKIAPYDLALIWGRLMEPDCLKTVTYSQSGRWYYYRYTGDFPLDSSYIVSHSSNNHIIPASNAILKCLSVIKVGQVVSLEGYLVNIDGKDGNYDVLWHSSRSRTDSGDGSCELFYVNKISINGITYI